MTIIVSSASVFESDQYKSLNAGANAFLPKPVQISELFEVLQKHLGIIWKYGECPESAHLPKKAEQDLQITSMASLIPPSQEVIDTLYDLVMKGNIRAIISQAEQLKASDERLIPFSEQLCELAKNYQEKKLRQLIKAFKAENNA